MKKGIYDINKSKVYNSLRTITVSNLYNYIKAIRIDLWIIPKQTRMTIASLQKFKAQTRNQIQKSQIIQSVPAMSSTEETSIVLINFKVKLKISITQLNSKTRFSNWINALLIWCKKVLWCWVKPMLILKIIKLN